MRFIMRFILFFVGFFAYQPVSYIKFELSEKHLINLVWPKVNTVLVAKLFLLCTLACGTHAPGARFTTI